MSLKISGQRFGMLTAIKPTDQRSSDGKIMWLCHCDCGSEVLVVGRNLVRGGTKSCGCSTRDFIRRAAEKHGGKGTRLYRIWKGIKQRCYNPNSPAYQHYGGRGIKMRPEWVEDFAEFRDYALSNGYADNLTTDRIDPNGNYEPDNIRWVDMRTQQNNRTNNHTIAIDGKTATLAEWSRITGISYKRLSKRIRAGWPPERLLEKVREYG